MMCKLPLIFKEGHLFVELKEQLWLFDTGSPKSFSKLKNLTIADVQFTLCKDYLGLSAATLSEFVGVQCVGLLGADILGHFDHILDLRKKHSRFPQPS